MVFEEEIDFCCYGVRNQRGLLMIRTCSSPKRDCEFFCVFCGQTRTSDLILREFAWNSGNRAEFFQETAVYSNKVRGRRGLVVGSRLWGPEGFRVPNPIPLKIRRVLGLLHVKSYVGEDQTSSLWCSAKIPTLAQPPRERCKVERGPAGFEAPLACGRRDLLDTMK
ncbi:hypothetical protein AVEN_189704-1 [Araneus ventricosus]|uniref:Uncharacterized protein n=1 Tax=Araneus ventricosus TaxID=182803 RepID=A0A4Y2Q0Z1_ARAVE|nr:hypothetical protein AVEN_189704-1 [Araneus ventricosus]